LRNAIRLTSLRGPMKSLVAFSIALALACVNTLAQKNSPAEYPLTEDSKPHDGVPKGGILCVLRG